MHSEQQQGRQDISAPGTAAANRPSTIALDARGWAVDRYSETLNAPDSAPVDTGKPKLVTRRLCELRPHPRYEKHLLSPLTSQLSFLSKIGDAAFHQPIKINQSGIIIDGYARWELAKRSDLPVLTCLEYEMTQEEALEDLIRTHCSSPGLPDFIRIELALDMESYFHQKATLNQESGGQEKGLSKLTEAQRIDTRREIARLAGVSSGNVRKVKRILEHACSALLGAARTREVSINMADRWSQKGLAQQEELLRQFRMHRGIKRVASGYVRSLTQSSPVTQYLQPIKSAELIELLGQTNSIEIEVLDAPGRTIFVTRELSNSLQRRREALLA